MPLRIHARAWPTRMQLRLCELEAAALRFRRVEKGHAVAGWMQAIVHDVFGHKREVSR